MKKTALVALVASILAFAGCGGGGGGSGSTTKTVSFLVSPPSGSTLPMGSTSAVYSQTFTVLSGGTGPYSFGAVGLPTGMTIVQLTNNAAAVTGTPTQTGQGILQFAIVDAAQNQEVEQYALSITGGANSLTVNPATLSGSFAAGQPFSQQLTTTGTPPIVWSYLGALPNGITFGTSQANTNSLTGTFTRAGTFNFSISTQDVTGATGTRAYTVVIQ